MSDNKTGNPFVGAMLGAALISLLSFISGFIHKDDPGFLFYLLGISTLICLIACLVPIFDAGLRRSYSKNSKASDLVLSLVVAAVAFIGLRAAEWVFNKVPDNGKLEEYGQVGDFIGGIFNPLISMVTLIFVFFAFRMQRKELENSEIALMDNKELVKIQRQDNAKAVYLNYISSEINVLEVKFSKFNEMSNSMRFLTDNDYRDHVINSKNEISVKINKLNDERNRIISNLRSLGGLE